MCVCVCPGVHFHRRISENKEKGARQLKRHKEALGRARDHRAGDHKSSSLTTRDQKTQQPERRTRIFWEISNRRPAARIAVLAGLLSLIDNSQNQKIIYTRE